jgi:PAS domain S-box-containing protein
MDELYRRLFEELPCYVTVQDREYRIVAANRMFRQDFKGEIGSPCYTIYKGRAEKCVECPVEKTFQDGNTHSSEEIVTLRTGEDINVITYTSPLRNEKGEIDSVVEISADITGVKRLQQKHRALFEEVPCYISVQDRDLKIIEANRQFRTHFGEGIGEYCYEVYKHRTEPCIRCSVAETFEDGKVRESEEVVTSQHGERMNVLVHTAPIRNSAGVIDSVIEMTTNITFLRQLQSQLASVGLIVSSVSHGIKGLLSGLDGGIYLMETGFKKDNMDRVKQGWDMMQRNVERIRSMVLNILYYAKDREVYYQPIDLEEIISSVEDVVASRAEAHDVDLRVEAEPDTFEADQNSLHSLLVNLVDNSIDACRVDKDKESHWVTVSAKIVGDYAVIDIADNGIGMDRETKEKAFSLFFSSKGAEGTGLGLFIAGKIVKSHSGAIDIESSPGVGTHIMVKLPKNKPAVQHHDVPVWDGGAGVGGD